MNPGDALVIVDVQNDFCPGGSLAVPGGDAVVPVLNQYSRRFLSGGLPVVVTRDWHPAQTVHFTSGGGVWPQHCVQNTSGARFHPELNLDERAIVLSKGMDPLSDGYSGFLAVTDDGDALTDLLRDLGVRRLFLGGLATDYCVLASTLDGLAAGFDVAVLTDAVRGVDLQPGDSDRALDRMRGRGAVMATLDHPHFRPLPGGA